LILLHPDAILERMFGAGLVDYGVQPWEVADPDRLAQAIAADPGDDRPAHLLAALTPADEGGRPRPLAELADLTRAASRTPCLPASQPSRSPSPRASALPRPGK
jgi:hypothetical protein